MEKKHTCLQIGFTYYSINQLLEMVEQYLKGYKCWQMLDNQQKLKVLAYFLAGDKASECFQKLTKGEEYCLASICQKLLNLIKKALSSNRWKQIDEKQCACTITVTSKLIILTVLLLFITGILSPIALILEEGNPLNEGDLIIMLKTRCDKYRESFSGPLE